MQLKNFFTKERLGKYSNEIVWLTLLQENFQINNYDECSSVFEEFKNSSSELLSEFNEFVESRCQESELYNYWNNVLILITLMHNLIRADRTGDWLLHVETVRNVQPIFHVMDRPNYARWCSIYLEDMIKLQETAPEAYREMCNGRFTVKHTNKSFSSVSTDQALEQTINRSSKSTSGIIGFTKKKEAVAAWEMTYHEFLSISNYFKNITLCHKESYELNVHHEYSQTMTQNSELAITNILNFLEKRQVNPFMPGPQSLRNIVTQELVQPEITQSLLSCFKRGIELYEKFREERYILKIKPFSAPISRTNLPNFATIPTSEKANPKKKKKSQTNEIQRIFALATERNFPIERLLTYDLTFENILFDENELLKKESNKSALIRELEKCFNNDEGQCMNSDVETCVIVDVMLVLRKIGWKGLKSFEEVATQFINKVKQRSDSQNTTRIDFIFDSYFNLLPKSSEHIRRCKAESIVYNEITSNTVLPKQEDTFWSSTTNKILLQTFLCSCIEKNKQRFPNTTLIFSTINDHPCKSINFRLSDISLLSLQRHDIEEADIKLNGAH